MDNRLLHLIQNGFEFHMGDYINKGFELCRKHWLTFVIATFVYAIISSVLDMAEERIWFLGAITAFLTTPLYMGLVIMISKAFKGETPNVGDLFEGFKYFVPLAIFVILVLLAVIPIIVLAGFLGFSIASPGASSTLAFVVFGVIFLLGMYFGVSISIAPMLIVFFKLSARDALVTSYNIVTKKWWTIFGFLFLTGIIAVLGILALGVGILYTIPAMVAAQFIAFATITNLYDGDGTERDILDHLVE